MNDLNEVFFFGFKKNYVTKTGKFFFANFQFNQKMFFRERYSHNRKNLFDLLKTKVSKVFILILEDYYGNRLSLGGLKKK